MLCNITKKNFIYWYGNLHDPMFRVELPAIFPGRET
jgi:hypothetical protein